MHILFLSDNFPPESNAPALRSFEHVREWVKSGEKVTVITSHPNFPEGKIYKGYKNHWFKKEIVQGVEVIRVKTFMAANKGSILRVIDFLSFMIMSFLISFFVKKVDLVFATSPQFFTAVSGWLVSIFKKKPFVFEVRDIWPSSINAVGLMKKNWIFNLLEIIELFLYSKASLIISVTNSFKDNLIKRGVDPQKIKIVFNGADREILGKLIKKNKDFEEKFNVKNKFVVGYVGTHGMAHALESVIDTAEKLKKYDQIRFLFVGGGSEKMTINSLVKQKELNNVVLYDKQKRKDIPKILGLCDVSLISLKDSDTFKEVIPSKIFENLALGIPMLISAPIGEATSLILETRSGILAHPENPIDLKHKILLLYNDKSLLSQLSKSSLDASLKYERKNLANILLSYLKKL